MTLVNSQTIRQSPVVVEKFVTLPATAGTTVGPAVSAGTAILAAGIELLQTVPNITTYTANISLGSDAIASGVALNNSPAGTVRAGNTFRFSANGGTVDAITTITGSPGTIRARIWALVVNVAEDSAREANEVKRDQLT